MKKILQEFPKPIVEVKKEENNKLEAPKVWSLFQENQKLSVNIVPRVSRPKAGITITWMFIR